MEPQFLINILFAVSGAAFGWILNNISRSIVRMEDRLSEMPLVYVTKADYKEDINDIKKMCEKIFDRLEGKADK